MTKSPDLLPNRTKKRSIRDTAKRLNLPPATVHRFRTGQDVMLSTAVAMLPELETCPCCATSLEDQPSTTSPVDVHEAADTIHKEPIGWQDIANIPYEYKDGRRLYLWCGGELCWGKWLVTKNVLRPDGSSFFTWRGWQVIPVGRDGQAKSFDPTLYQLEVPPTPPTDREGE